jgi:hypothetical protein
MLISIVWNQRLSGGNNLHRKLVDKGEEEVLRDAAAAAAARTAAEPREPCAGTAGVTGNRAIMAMAASTIQVNLKSKWQQHDILLARAAGSAL